MPQENVFGDLVPSAQQAPVPPSQSIPSGSPTAPGVIYGKPKAPDPYKVQQDQIGNANEAERIRLAREASDRAAANVPSGYRAGPGGTLEPIPGGPNDPTKPGGKPTGEENTAAFLATRVASGIDKLREVGSAGNPTLGSETVGLFGKIGNYATPEGRQRSLAAQRDVLDAALTLGTGAAYSKEQLDGYQQSYFPQIGDSPTTIKDKQDRLMVLLQAARVKAGAAAPAIDAALQAAGLTNPANSPDSDQGGMGAGLRDPNGNPVGPDYEGPTFNPDGTPGPLAVTIHDDSPPAPDGGQSLGQAFGAGVGDVVQGAGDVLGIVGNPVNATINAVTGSDLSTDLGKTLRDASGLPDSQNPTVSAINRAGTGGLGMAGAARLLSMAPGVLGSAADIAASRPVQQGISAATGGGSSEIARQNGAGPMGQLAAGLAGGIAGFGGANALSGLVGKSAGAPNALLQAAGRQGVDMLPADVGGPMTRRLTGAAAQAPVSAGPVVNAAQRSTTQTGNALARTAANQGEVMTTDVAGEQVRKAGQEYVKNESARIGRLYDTAGAAAKGVKIKPNQALSEIDSQIARFSEIGDVGKPIVKSLQSLRSGIEGGVSVQGMRDARTLLSQGVYDGKLRSNQEQKLLGDIIEKLSSDIELGLQNAGRGEAARTFKRADTLWRERIQHIDEVLEPVVGKAKSGEDVLKAVEGMMRGTNGGAARLRGVMKEMPPEQAGNVRATIIDRLGKAGAGAQDETGSAFSSATFLTNWNKMTPQAKAVLFSEDKLRGNLDDIAKIASATKQAQRYANHSNTSGAITGNIAGLLGIGYVSPAAAAAGLGGQYLTGKLLASPRFTAWLARAPKNPETQLRYVEQLGVIASKEPAIAGDARAIQQFLTERLTGSPGRAAASEQDKDGRPKPPQR